MDPASANPEPPLTASELGVIITNASGSLMDRLGGLSAKQRLVLGLAPAAAIIGIIWLLGHNSGGILRVLFYIVVLGVSAFGSLAAQLRLHREHSVLEGFARDNGYTYDQHGQVDESYGRLLRAQGNPAVSDVVSGSYRGHALKLFALTLTISTGRNNTTYQDTVVELDLAGRLPELLLLNQRSHFGGLNLALGDSQLGMLTPLNPQNRVDLEGDFSQHFTLYASGNDQVAAREVFTPDLMQFLADNMREFSVELVANRVYIYAHGLLAQPADLAQLFGLARKLVDILEPLSARLASDPSIAAPVPNQIANPPLPPLTFSSANHRVIWIIIAAGAALPLIFALAILLTR